MNPDNVGTREACKKLQTAGIVLETDVYWYKNLGEEQTNGDRIGETDWYLHSKYFYHPRGELYVPAPSLAEGWRELPKRHPTKNFGLCPLIMLADDNDETIVCYGPASLAQIVNTNPTDALIELRIWLEGKRKETEDA